MFSVAKGTVLGDRGGEKIRVGRAFEPVVQGRGPSDVVIALTELLRDDRGWNWSKRFLMDEASLSSPPGARRRSPTGFSSSASASSARIRTPNATASTGTTTCTTATSAPQQDVEVPLALQQRHQRCADLLGVEPALRGGERVRDLFEGRSGDLIVALRVYAGSTSLSFRVFGRHRGIGDFVCSCGFARLRASRG